MTEKRVILFPSVTACHPSRSTDRLTRQSCLFDLYEESQGRIVFLDIKWLEEEILFNIVVRNTIASIADLRPRPIFPRPLFEHKKVVSYLYERNIFYFEYAMHARHAINKHCPPTVNTKETFSRLLNRGLTTFIYDDAAKAAGWINDVRSIIQYLPEYSAEIHPRSLFGMPTHTHEAYKSI